jgi:hypothetical protein
MEFEQGLALFVNCGLSDSLSQTLTIEYFSYWKYTSASLIKYSPDDYCCYARDGTMEGMSIRVHNLCYVSVLFFIYMKKRLHTLFNFQSFYIYTMSSGCFKTVLLATLLNSFIET